MKMTHNMKRMALLLYTATFALMMGAVTNHKGFMGNNKITVIQGEGDSDSEAYLVLSDDSTNVTFYYDGEKDNRNGTSLVKYNGLKTDVAAKVKKVTFHESFANARPTSTKQWFYKMSNLESIEGMKDYLNTSAVENMSYMFGECSKLTQLDLSGFNTANVNDMSAMFYKCSNIESLDVSGFKTHNVSKMNFMFSECSSLTNLNLGDLNTSNVIDMSAMFYGCRRLTKLDVGNLETGNVTNMQAMFENCSDLTELDVSNFDTSKLITDNNKKFLFNGCSGLKELSISSTMGNLNEDACDGVGTEEAPCLIYASEDFDFGVSTSGNFQWKSGWFTLGEGEKEAYLVLSEDGKNVTFYYDRKKDNRNGIPLDGYQGLDKDEAANVVKVTFDASFAEARPTSTYYWFHGMKKLKSIEGMDKLNTSNVENMRSMFSGCNSLESIDLSNFNTGNVKNMRSMFNGCKSLTSLDVSGFNTSKVDTLYAMFSDCSKLTALKLSNFDTSNVTTMESMFYNCSGLTELNLSNFNTSNVTTMEYMFFNCSGLTSLDLSNFDTENVTTMRSMFYGCKILKTLVVDSFKTSKVETMQNMFFDCSSLNSLNLSNFETKNVTTMLQMFYNCESLESLDLSKFETSKVKNMKLMFGKCSNLSSLNISNFNTSNVTSMNSMFTHCQSLTTLDVSVSGFNTSKVTDMNYMFNECNNLKTLDLSNFDTSNATTKAMFDNDYSLEHLTISGTMINLNDSACNSVGKQDVPCIINAPVGFKFGDDVDIYNAFQWKSGWFRVEKKQYEAPQNLIISNIQENQATIRWNNDGKANSWKVVWADNPNYLNKKEAEVKINSLTLGSLLPDTKYHIMVCGLYDGVESEYAYTTFHTIGSYLLLSEDKKTLTFYHDNLKEERQGTPFKLADYQGLEDDLAKEVTKVVFDSLFKGAKPTSTRRWFYVMENLSTIEGLEYLNTSEVTSMRAMFTGCKNLKSIDLRKFDTSKVESMRNMFNDCSSLQTLDVGTFKTSNVTDMYRMFNGCSQLKSLDLSHFDTSNVTDMYRMFCYCNELTSIDVSSFNTEKVGTMDYMFNECTNLKTLDINNFVISDATTTSYMFDNCRSLEFFAISGTMNNLGTKVCKGVGTEVAPCLIQAPAGFNFGNGIDTSNTFQWKGGWFITYYPAPTDFKAEFGGEKDDGVYYKLSWKATFEPDHWVIDLKKDNDSQKTINVDGYLTSTILDSLAYKHEYKATLHGEYKIGDSYKPSLSVDMTFTPEIDFVNVIQFANNEVERICVSEWDKNKSGKLEYSEAQVVSSLGDAFRGTDISSFEELRYFTGLESIESDAFNGCEKLTSITIPRGVKKIETTKDANPFTGCDALEVINVDEENPVYISSNNVVMERSSKMVVVGCNYSTVPNDATGIGQSAFNGCKGLNVAYLPNGVTIIGEAAFKGCTALETLKLSENLTSIGANAFEGCGSLSALVLYDKLATIGGQAFAGCENLTSLTTKRKTTPDMDENTFAQTVYQKCTLVVPQGSKGQYMEAKGWKNFGQQLEYVIFANGDLKSECLKWDANKDGELDMDEANEVDNNLWDILKTFASAYKDDYTFDELQYFTKLEEIPKEAFKNDLHLIAVTLPNSITVIHDEAFQGCTALTAISLPNGVENVGNRVFMACSKLESIGLPESLKTIGKSAFQDCKKLEWIELPKAMETLEDFLCLGCDNLSNVGIPESVKTIGAAVFENCNSLKQITIPANVTSIGEKAFFECNFEEIHSDMTEPAIIQENTFSKYDGVRLWVPNGSEQKYRNADFWENFGDSIRSYNNKLTVTVFGSEGKVKYGNEEINGAITKYPDSETSENKKLTFVPSNNDGRYGSNVLRLMVNGENKTDEIDYGESISYAIPGLKDKDINIVVYLADRVSSDVIYYGKMNKEAIITGYKDIDVFTRLDIPANIGDNQVTEVKDHAFAFGNKLSAVVIPEGVKNIRHGAFMQSTELHYVDLPASLEQIADSAFAGCGSLNAIRIRKGQPWEVKESTFAGVTFSEVTLYVPKGCKDKFKENPVWKKFNIVEDEGSLNMIVSVSGNGTVTWRGHKWTNVENETIPNILPGETDVLVFNCKWEEDWLNSVYLDGVECTSVVDNDRLVLLNLTKDNYKINITFSENKYFDITLQAIGNGLITSNLGNVPGNDGNGVNVRNETKTYSKAVKDGGNVKLKFEPDSKYQVVRLIINGEEITLPEENNYVISSNDSLVAIFGEKLKEAKNNGLFTYGETEDGIWTFRSANFKGHVVIPDKLDDRVLRIPDGAFAFCPELKSVVVPASVTESGSQVFEGTDNLYAVAWNAAIKLNENIKTSNPYFLLYVIDAKYKPDNQNGKLIVNNMFKSDNFVFNDKDLKEYGGFWCPQDFTVEKTISYTHHYSMKTEPEICKGWESIVLPFDVRKIILTDEDKYLQTFTQYVEDRKDGMVTNGVPFWLYQYDGDEWVPAESIKANKPYIISMPNYIGYNSDYNISGDVKFYTSDYTEVHKSTDIGFEDANGDVLVPNYEVKEPSSTIYVLNVNEEVDGYLPGSVFLPDYRKALPFEAYLHSTSNAACIGIFDDQPTGLPQPQTIIPYVHDGTCRVVTPTGIVVRETRGKSLEETLRGLPNGLYIVNGKKIMIRK